MNNLSRRDFLKLGALSTGALAFRPLTKKAIGSGFNFPDELGEIGRVAATSLSIHKEPNDDSVILYQRYRDDLVNIYYEVVAEDGPQNNPIWYRVWGGYIHSAHLVKVKNQLNPIQYNIPEEGLLTEVSVPYSQSYRYSPHEGWTPLYRLYYGSVHWIIGIDEGPDGTPWYKIEDEMDSYYIYYVPAHHLRIIPPNELAPISPEIPSENKRIDIDLNRQTLTAFEYDNAVFHTSIASGLPRANVHPPTNTPVGEFHVSSKMPSKHMGEGQLTSDIEAYELPGVPWTVFFEPNTGVAMHGTFWHKNFGTRMSHGCINMVTEEAKWIFRWTTPISDPVVVEKRGYGTLVRVF
ncbi:MAG: L,D-transpeptidase [Anaerolineaceae bacterium]|nr:L,D-transpeptidase [Anaerolineaceae bacterium]